MRAQQPPRRMPAKAGEEIIRDLVRALQVAFYPETVGDRATDKRAFYQDLRMLRQAVTWPANWLTGKGWSFEPARYEEIFHTIIRAIKIHGQPAEQMRRRSAYILHAVQDHWKHNWDRYYEEWKAFDAQIQESLAVVLKAGQSRPAEDTSMQVLAAAYKALSTGRPKRAAAPKPKPAAPVIPAAREIQAELF